MGPSQAQISLKFDPSLGMSFDVFVHFECSARLIGDFNCKNGHFQTIIPFKFIQHNQLLLKDIGVDSAIKLE